MVNVSKKYLSKELQTKAWARFLDEVRGSRSPEVFILNLKKFLTSSEITMLEKRLSIPILVERGLSYKDIGATVDVSPNTISFVKHNLTKRPAVHKKVIVRSDPKRKRPPQYKGSPRIF